MRWIILSVQISEGSCREFDIDTCLLTFPWHTWAGCIEWKTEKLRGKKDSSHSWYLNMIFVCAPNSSTRSKRRLFSVDLTKKLYFSICLWKVVDGTLAQPCKTQSKGPNIRWLAPLTLYAPGPDSFGCRHETSQMCSWDQNQGQESIQSGCYVLSYNCIILLNLHFAVYRCCFYPILPN